MPTVSVCPCCGLKLTEIEKELQVCDACGWPDNDLNWEESQSDDMAEDWFE